MPSPLKAALLGLALLAVPDAALAATGDAWHLQKIVVANHLDPTVELVHHYADASNGNVGLDLDGSVQGICPGGSDNLEFSWRMPDAGILQEGATFEIEIDASGFGFEPCSGAMSARSTIAVQDASAKPDALAEQTMKAVDRTRFRIAATTPHGPGKDGYSAPAWQDIALVAGPAASSRPYAYFVVRMAVFGSARGIDIVYVYSKEAAPVVPPTVGQQLPPPG